MTSIAESHDLMQRFTQMLRETQEERCSPSGVLRVGFHANHKVGKSTFITGIHQALGEHGDTIEKMDESARHVQTLRKYDDVGFVRHYDAVLRQEFRLKAYDQSNFWDRHQGGLDLSENAIADKDQDFDFIIEIEKEELFDRRPDSPRIVTIHADPRHDDNNAYKRFIMDAKETYFFDEALQEESTFDISQNSAIDNE